MYNSKDFEKFALSKGIGSNKLNSYKNYINPTIIEEREMNMQAWDVFSRLMAERIIYLGEGINSDVEEIYESQTEQDIECKLKEVYSYKDINLVQILIALTICIVSIFIICIVLSFQLPKRLKLYTEIQ